MLRSLLDWLRAGYPERVPGGERVPLLALLTVAPLSDEQIRHVVGHLTAPGSSVPTQRSIDEAEIQMSIKTITGQDAGPDDVARVAATLAAAGWPLTGTGDTGDLGGTH